MGRITHLGKHRRDRLTVEGPSLLISTHERREHEGRVPQPGVPAGPRNGGTKRAPGSESAGYHSDLSIPGYQPKTPTVASPTGEAPTGPAGLYGGAGREYGRATVALPPPVPPPTTIPTPLSKAPVLASLEALLAPLAPAPVGSALKALLSPSDGLSAILKDSSPETPHVTAAENGGVAPSVVRDAALKAGKFAFTGNASDLGSYDKAVADAFYKQHGKALWEFDPLTGRFKGSKPGPDAQGRLAEWRQARNGGPRPIAGSAANPATAVFSTSGPAHAPVNPNDPLGNRTPGNASLADLAAAGKAGTLKIGPGGRITTPAERQAITQLHQAQQEVANSGASLRSLHQRYPELNLSTLRAYRASTRLTGVPPQLLAGIEGQESDYGRSTLPGVRSGANEAGASGPFQIGTGGGAAGDWWHEHEPASRSPYKDRDAAIAAGEYLTEAGATKDPSTWYDAALSYNHADWYAAKAVELAQQHKGLAQLGNPPDPKARAALAEAKENAREVGIDPETVIGAGHHGLGPVAPEIMTRFQAGLKAAKQLQHAGFPYSWAGGHDAAFAPGGEQENGGPGYDCSGSVSYVLHAMGVLESPLSSGEMGSVLEPGPGAVTVFYNSTHTFMKIGKRYFGTSNSNPAGGAGFIDASTAASEAQSGAYNVGHVPGLGKKVALQLGLSPAELAAGGSAPGMTFGEGGTTATINPGAGTTIEGGAKYSNAPIEVVQLSSPTPAGPVLPSLASSEAGSGGEDSIGELLELLGSGRRSATGRLT